MVLRFFALDCFSTKSKVWISNPSWPNHKPIFEASGFKVDIYPYFNSESNSIDFENMISVIKEIPEGDILVLHGCCHNPTGEDLKGDQWDQISEISKKNNLLVICDFAYQGLGDGLGQGEGQGMDGEERMNGRKREMT